MIMLLYLCAKRGAIVVADDRVLWLFMLAQLTKRIQQMNEIRSFSLYDLLGSVRRCLTQGFTSRYWVRAETSEVRRAGVSGHCYLELVEKGQQGSIRARVRASIWSGQYAQIEARLRSAGLPPLVSGMEVLVLTEVTYHEQYGLSLVIHDIDPSYSLGELARLRQETIARLKREGIIDDNKGLPLPRPLSRLAIVSSATAAGLGDFMDQLHHNRYGLVFYTALFVAQMQGETTGGSVMAAMDRILGHEGLFDAVVIIRGGGATSDLRAFDSYELCAYTAQYPLPVLCGIGHERDESVLDLVAHTSLKTPTAVAEHLIHLGLGELSLVQSLSERIASGARQLSLERHRALDTLEMRLPLVANRYLHGEHLRQAQLRQGIGSSARAQLETYRRSLELSLPRIIYMSQSLSQHRHAELARLRERIRLPLSTLMARYRQQLDQYEQAVRLSSPETVLRRGFALVRRGEQIITEASDLSEGDELSIQIGTTSASARVH